MHALDWIQSHCLPKFWEKCMSLNVNVFHVQTSGKDKITVCIAHEWLDSVAVKAQTSVVDFVSPNTDEMAGNGKTKPKSS